MGFLICRVCLQLLLLLLLLTFTSPQASAQPQPPPPGTARALDAALQEYAFRALAARPRTGIIYNATIPATLAGVAASALRLRSGSLRRKGVAGYFNFAVPPGVTVQPRVERVVLVYHDLGNLSDRYYPLPAGYAYVAPVVGLLAYDAANLSAAAGGLPELGLVVAASGRPISVAFGGGAAWTGGPGGAPRCVVFGLDGVPRFRDLEGPNVCTTYRQGHVSIVVNSSGIAPPIPTEGGGGGNKGSAAAWRIAVGVVGGAVALGLLAALLLFLARYRRDKKLQVMERNAEAGEALRMARVGRTQAPVALGTRTQPVIENDYAA